MALDRSQSEASALANDVLALPRSVACLGAHRSPPPIFVARP